MAQTEEISAYIAHDAQPRTNFEENRGGAERSHQQMRLDS